MGSAVYFHCEHLGLYAKLRVAMLGNMASLIKQFSRRKSESDVHKYFRYSVYDNKSVCFITDNNGKECGFQVSGKNTTKSHIQHHHEDAHE